MRCFSPLDQDEQPLRVGFISATHPSVISRSIFARPRETAEHTQKPTLDKSNIYVYKHFFKRLIDLILSLIGSIILLPFFIIFGLIIFVDDPGPIFFRQKRVGKNKKLFTLWKFRTMKTKTPDIPTHLLEHPEQYITRVGRVFRKLSIDELPQIWQILFGKMALIGPRPALWNQDDLIAERDKYGANAVKPGLTGWAQINGRDELEIPEKAALDGEYVKRMSFVFDCKCFFGTIKAVFKHDGVVEGGTGELHKNNGENGSESGGENVADTSEEVEVAETAVCEDVAEPAKEEAAERTESVEDTADAEQNEASEAEQS